MLLFDAKIEALFTCELLPATTVTLKPITALLFAYPPTVIPLPTKIPFTWPEVMLRPATKVFAFVEVTFSPNTTLCLAALILLPTAVLPPETLKLLPTASGEAFAETLLPIKVP